jgi:hypothetical protein
MSPPDRIPRERGRALNGAPTGADGRFDAIGVEQIHDPPPAGARAIFEMAFDAGVGTVQPMVDLVDAFVDGIALRHRKFCALFEIDDERQRHFRAAGPMRIWRRVGIAEKIAVAGIDAGLIGHRRQSPVPAMRCNPTNLSLASRSTIVAIRMSVDSAASVGSGASSIYCSILIGNVLARTSVRKIETG